MALACEGKGIYQVAIAFSRTISKFRKSKRLQR
jgi:hypothetical protein